MCECVCNAYVNHDNRGLDAKQILVILAGGTCLKYTLGLSIYVFPRVLALPTPIATCAKPYCHTLRKSHTSIIRTSLRF
jgi:hypothetical protein